MGVLNLEKSERVVVSENLRLWQCLSRRVPIRSNWRRLNADSSQRGAHGVLRPERREGERRSRMSLLDSPAPGKSVSCNA